MKYRIATPFLAVFKVALLCLLFQSSSPAQERTETKPSRVRASMPGVAVSFSPVELGAQKGIFRDEGLEIELLVIRGNVALAALISDELDYIIGFGNPNRAAARGMPLKLVAGVDTRPVWFLVARPEIKTVRDLKGKRIGVGSIKGSVQLAAALALEQNGLPSREVSWLSVGTTPTRLQAMANNAVDAAVIALPGNINARKMGFRELMDVGEIAPIPTVGLVASEKKLAQQSSEVRKMIRAMIRSTRYFLARKNEAVQFIAKRFNFSTDEARLVYEQQIPALTASGDVNEKGILLDFKFAREAGENIAEVSLEKIVDLRLLKEVQKELGQNR